MNIRDIFRRKKTGTSTTFMHSLRYVSANELSHVDKTKLEEAIQIQQKRLKTFKKQWERKKATWQPLLNEQDKIEVEINTTKEKMKKLPLSERLNFMPQIAKLTDDYNVLGQKLSNLGCQQIRYLTKIPNNSVAWLEYCKILGEKL